MRKLFFAVLCMCSAIASALDMDVTHEGVKYTIDVMNRTASVTKILDDETNPTPGKIVIPEVLNINLASLGTAEIPVTSIATGDTCCTGEARISLAELEIPGSIKVIPSESFYECVNLEHLTIHEGVEVIECKAFSHCYNLSKIKFPNTLTSIGDYAFECAGGLSYLYLPKNLTHLGTGAFFRSSVARVECNDALEAIGSYAFSKCSHLNYIFVSRSVSVLGDHAFAECSHLRTFEASELDTIGAYAFSECDILREVRLGSFVDVIKDGAFSGCKSLESLYIYKLKDLESNVFQNCTSLSSVDMSTWYGEIGEGTFSGCTSLNNVQWSAGLYVIPSRTFLDCSGLTSFNIPTNVHTICKDAFENCGLTEIEIHDRLCVLEDAAFRECMSLNRVVFNGEILERVGGQPFKGCDNLKELEWSEGVTTIPNLELSNVEKVILPESAKTIEKYAFGSCMKLREVHLPSNLEVIGNSAFAYCTSLISINFPESITTIGESAFRYCENLTEVTSESSNPIEISENVFENIPDFSVLMVPEGSQELYRNAEGWSKFGHIWSEEDIERLTGVQNIEQKSSSVTYNLNGVKSSGKGIVISNGKKYIR